jgi:hypothetical protein
MRPDDPTDRRRFLKGAVALSLAGGLLDRYRGRPFPDPKRSIASAENKTKI